MKQPKREQTLAQYFCHPEAIRRGLKAMEGREEEILDGRRRHGINNMENNMKLLDYLQSCEGDVWGPRNTDEVMRIAREMDKLTVKLVKAAQTGQVRLVDEVTGHAV